MGISATTSLAIDLARAVNLTLIGFSRKENGTIYTCPERILFNHC
jgi:formate dehydrogenase accessory protein FdhD